MKRRILFISNPANYTGAPLYLYNLLRHLDTQQILEKAILLRGGGDLAPHFAKLYPTYLIDGAQVLGLPPKAFGRFDCIEDFYRAYMPDLVYSNTITNGSLVKVAHDFHIPVILHVQEMKPAFQKHTAAYLEETLSCSHYICVSHAVREYLYNDYDLAPDKLSVIHNSIDMMRIDKMLSHSTPESVKAMLGIPKDAIVIGGVGAMALHKGVDLWLQVAKRVTMEMSGANPYFVWVGQDTNEYAAEMKRNVAMMGLSNRVFFPGMTTNPYPYIKAMDIFIMSSRYESIGLVNIEAAYLEVPIVCFGCAGGPREVVEPDGGIVIEELDTYEMSLAVIELVRDRQLRKILGTNARRRAISQFDIRVASMRIADIINEFVT